MEAINSKNGDGKVWVLVRVFEPTKDETKMVGDAVLYVTGDASGPSDQQETITAVKNVFGDAMPKLGFMQGLVLNDHCLPPPEYQNRILTREETVEMDKIFSAQAEAAEFGSN